jgi:hypothetical protein
VLTRAGARVQAAATQELVKAEAIQTNEAILATMKGRLAKVEENLIANSCLRFLLVPVARIYGGDPSRCKGTPV